ncbi:MAG: cadmium-translocating P-type ATPase [Desulfobacteraceae bacterium]|nr:MAG: cadmium-translocating P-type ATPase [Desulfobacteraceae bacterium]
MIDETFRVKNIDCASCAAKIEHGLKSVEGIEDAVLDFATLTLHVKAMDLQRVVDKIQSMNPEVELVPKTRSAEQDTGSHVSRNEVVVLCLSILLFTAQLFSEDWIHRQPFAHLEIVIVLVAYVLAGWKVIVNAVKTILRLDFFDENVLMVIATIGAIAIHAYSEAIGVMIFFKIGELLQEAAVSRSRRSIRGLLNARPDKAMVRTPDGYREVHPESVAVGEIVLVKPGEKIPLDGTILSGSSQIDTSALTGEFIPVIKNAGDPVMAGQINKTGALTVSITKPFAESSISKIMDLVENATAKKAKTEKFITTFARYYTPMVVIIAACIALIPPLLMADASFETWLYRALVILVISCPCALVISIPLGYFGGIGKASRNGILVKGSNFIDALSSIKTVVFDKTGTLTRGVFVVNDVITLNGYSRTEVLEFAAAAEYQSTHPIATSILSAYTLAGGELKTDRISDHKSIDGKGVSAIYKEHSVLVGNDSLLHQEAVNHDQCVFETTVAQVVVDGKLAGILSIGDKIRSDAQITINSLRDNGVEQIVMLTGDNHCSAQAVSIELGLDRYYSDLLPEQKVAVFEGIAQQAPKGSTIAFVGDGLNDAPVLARADVGIAMGAMGSDAAIETADVVLMTDSPFKVAEAVTIARQTRKIVWQNIFLALAIKGIFISFGAFGLASMWEAVFADVGTALLAIVNSSRILRM